MAIIAASQLQEPTRFLPGNGGDVLTLSMRALARLVAYCLPYEFEDAVTELTGADRVCIGGGEALEFARRTYKLARFATRSRRFAEFAAAKPSIVRLQRDYELFFPIFNDAYELFALACIPEWRKHCRVAACFVSEIWVQQLPGYLLELLAAFDHVFIGVSHPVEDVRRIVGRPCSYLPLATDVLRFSPYPDLPPRVINVCNIGRRSPVTHEVLIKLARERRIFYYYDTVAASGDGGKQRTFSVESASEHRLLLANLLRRSRYFFANRGRINEPELERGHHEISGRFYEGAAAGTVMLGEPPETTEFRRQFDWSDAIIRFPFECPDAARILAELDADPQRLERISRDNARNAALRHDWLHRLRLVFKTLELKETRAMRAREQQLQALVAQPQVSDPERVVPGRSGRRE
jgi:hypothetical protein